MKAASEFASRNHLPHCIQDQMLAHICLRYRTEGLKQQETLNDLPKAIRSNIAHHLFFPVVQKVYLFQGVSHDFLFQLVILYPTHTCLVCFHFLSLLSLSKTCPNLTQLNEPCNNRFQKLKLSFSRLRKM